MKKRSPGVTVGCVLTEILHARITSGQVLKDFLE